MPDPYTALKLTGTVNVLPQSGPVRKIKPLHSNKIHVIILMGPIGSGKSSFIQSLAAKTPAQPGGSVLQIAKDQLEGATRDVTVYEVINVTPRIYLVDTPGGADETISEMRVGKMLQDFYDANGDNGGMLHLYFHPINHVRVNRTLQTGLAIFKSTFSNQVGLNTKRRTALITTMWDQLFTPEQITRAENRLAALQEQYWENFNSKGSAVLKFENTQESALRILDKLVYVYRLFFDITITLPPTTRTQHGQLLHDSLLQRIESIRQQLQFINQELARCELELEENDTGGPAGDNSSTNELKDLLTSRRSSLTANLEQYEKEMSDFLAYTDSRWLMTKWFQKYILR